MGDSTASPTATSPATANTASANVEVDDKSPNLPRRIRASRACQSCHKRKIRCDIMSRGVPCTNCTDYAVDCLPHVPRPRVCVQRRWRRRESSPEAGWRADRNMNVLIAPRERHPIPDLWSSMLPAELHGWLPQFEYLGESLSLAPLQDGRKAMDIYHPLSRGSPRLPSGLDPFQVAILAQQGAFLLPYKELRDELIGEFFIWVAPVVPVVSQASFMDEYKNGRFSLLLVQAMLLAASKVSSSKRLRQIAECSISASEIFYKRCKALYDAGYETDQVAILQALILMGWYCEDPRGVGTTFYWSRIAIAIAQSIGIHRRVTGPNLSLRDKRLYKRVWWTLFARDRLLSVCLGRPAAINLADCDVDLIEEDDFVEVGDHPFTQKDTDDNDNASNRLHALFFVHYVKLSKILGQILSTYYSASSKAFQGESDPRLQYDNSLREWLHQRPPEVVWHSECHEFWAAVLHLHYCVATCLLHRAHIPEPEDKTMSDSLSFSGGFYLSRQAACNAAGCITDIVKRLIANDQLNRTPPFIVYCLYSALLVHVYELHKTRPIAHGTTSNTSTTVAVPSHAKTCLYALERLSGSWTVANLIHMVFGFLLSSASSSSSSSLSGHIHTQDPNLSPNPHPITNNANGNRKADPILPLDVVQGAFAYLQPGGSGSATSHHHGHGHAHAHAHEGPLFAPAGLGANMSLVETGAFDLEAMGLIVQGQY